MSVCCIKLAVESETEKRPVPISGSSANGNHVCAKLAGRIQDMQCSRAIVSCGEACTSFEGFEKLSANWPGPGLFERFCLAARCTERCSHGRVADSLVPGIFPNTLEARGFVVLWLYHSLTHSFDKGIFGK